MKLTLLSLILSSVSLTALADDVHWQYSGKHGSEHWAELSDKFSTCASGVNQSPINISSTIEAELPPLSINYQKSAVELINNGHTIQVNIQGNNSFSNDAGQFDLKQFHFHSPSENTINGQYYPLEAHFVHADNAGRLAVIGVMFKQGDENKTLKKLWHKMPEKTHGKAKLSGVLQSLNLMPKSKDYYRFNGSLTTPPCSEGVRWFVLKQPIEASKAQIDKFRAVMGGDTNRPIQPINARIILK